MTLSTAHAAFSQDVYRGANTALRASRDCLLEFYEHCPEATHSLPGSLLSTGDGWSLIPLAEDSVKRVGAVTKALVQPADGSAAKTLSIKDVGGGIDKKIIPAVLSSHLGKSRVLKQALAAKDIQGVGALAGQLVRVAVKQANGPTLVIKTAAVHNHEDETTHESPEALENHINRDLLSFVSIRGEPPEPEHNHTAPGEIDVTEWAVSRAAMEWRHTRTNEKATDEQIEKELEQGSFAVGYEQLVQAFTDRMYAALTDIGIADAQRTLHESVATLGLLAAKIVEAEPWAKFFANALDTRRDFRWAILDRLVYWVEGKKAANPDAFQPLQAAGELPQDEQTKKAAALLVAPTPTARPRPPQPPPATATRRTAPEPTNPPDIPAFDTPRLPPPPPPRLDGTPDLTPEPVARSLATHPGLAPQTPAAPIAAAREQEWLDECMQAFCPEPTPPSALDWLTLLGGEPVGKAIAAAAGKGDSLVAIMSARGAANAVKTLRTMVMAEIANPHTSLDMHDELWTTSTRPADVNDALARIEEVCNAAKRSSCAPRPSAAAFGAPPTAFNAFAASPFGQPPPAAPHLANHGPQQRPGQVKLPLASNTQREARTVCSSAMLEPIHSPALVDQEFKLGSAAERGADLPSELRRAAAFTPAVKHALAAFVVSAGARPEDASGGVPANFSQMRQGCLSALRDRAELAKGGRMQREMTTAVYKSTSNAAEGILAGEVDVAQLVKLFGGVSPAQTLYTMGSAGQGRDGSTSSKRDIEKALRWWTCSFDAVLGPLLQCPKGPEGDFGLGDFLREAEHVDAPRLLRASEETFRLISRQFQDYRTSFDAPPPDPQRALSDAIVSAIRPLAHEQNTAAIAREAVAAKQGAAGKDDGAKAQKLIDAQGAELAKLKRRIETIDRNAELGARAVSNS